MNEARDPSPDVEIYTLPKHIRFYGPILWETEKILSIHDKKSGKQVEIPKEFSIINRSML